MTIGKWKGWQLDIFQVKAHRFFLTRTHIRGCLSTAAVLYICLWNKESGSLRKFNLFFKSGIFKWHVPPNSQSLPPRPPVWSWAQVCRGVLVASSRGRQRSSGRWLDTVTVIWSATRTVWLRTRPKHLWHLQRQRRERFQTNDNMTDCVLYRYLDSCTEGIRHLSLKLQDGGKWN